MKDFDRETLYEDIKRLGKNYIADIPRIKMQTNTLAQQNDRHYRLISRKIEQIRQYKIANESNLLYKHLDEVVESAFYQEGGILFYGLLLQEYTEKIMEEDASLQDMWQGGYNSGISRMYNRMVSLQEKVKHLEEKRKMVPVSYEKKVALLEAIEYHRYAPVVRAILAAAEEKNIEEAQSLLQELNYITEKNRKLAERIQHLPDPDGPYQMKYSALLQKIYGVIRDDGRVQSLSKTEGWRREEYQRTLKAYSLYVQQELIVPFGQTEKQERI